MGPKKTQLTIITRVQLTLPNVPRFPRRQTVSQLQDCGSACPRSRCPTAPWHSNQLHFATCYMHRLKLWPPKFPLRQYPKLSGRYSISHYVYAFEFNVWYGLNALLYPVLHSQYEVDRTRVTRVLCSAPIKSKWFPLITSKTTCQICPLAWV